LHHRLKFKPEPISRSQRQPGDFVKHLEETSEQRNAIVRAYANVAAKGARQALEGWHAGFSPAPGGRVEWSGGSCLYTDAARLSKGSLRALTLASSTLAEKKPQDFF
jgi:hypothetical protein